MSKQQRMMVNEVVLLCKESDDDLDYMDDFDEPIMDGSDDDSVI